MKNTANSSMVVPIFPLPVVLFPSEELPLHIFENRYRAMVKDVCDGNKIFGVIGFDAQAKSLADTGCLARIVSVAGLPDGRSNILVRGFQRFSIEELVDGRPYKQARVRYLEDSAVGFESFAAAREVHRTLDDIARLSSKLHGHPTDVLDDRPSDPTELSYWIPSRLYGTPSEQQRMLDMDSVLDRLNAEYAVLNETLKHLAAKNAIESAFS